MDDKKVDDYVRLITSQHRHKERYIAMIKVVSQPMTDCFNFLNNLNAKFDVETAEDPYLNILAHWTGTPLIIPGAAQLAYFGFEDQENSLTFGELDDPEIGGYFRESGQSGTGGLVPKGEFLRRLIQAKILKNHSTGNIEETKQILSLVLNHDQFKVIDNNDMSVTFINQAPRISETDKILIRMFFPLPSGVELIIEG